MSSGTAQMPWPSAEKPAPCCHASSTCTLACLTFAALRFVIWSLDEIPNRTTVAVADVDVSVSDRLASELVR